MESMDKGGKETFVLPVILIESAYD